VTYIDIVDWFGPGLTHVCPGRNTVLRGDHRPKTAKARTKLRQCVLSRGKERLEMRGPTGIIGIIVTIVVIFLILRFLGLI
jgi:hypothetical protein